MKISYNWLKKYIDIEAPVEELENTLSMIGHEVDGVEQTGLPPLDKVFVGEVLSKTKHPDADRLNVCEVNVGDGEPKQIVCAATNYEVGDKVPTALHGAKLPGNFKIKRSKVRGVESLGMMCAKDELGLASGEKGLWILPEDSVQGTPINDVFSGGDSVFDLAITANRGDCLSHIGIARELAAYYNLKVKMPEVQADAKLSTEAGKDSLLKNLTVTSESCPLYTAWSLRGVQVGPSPEWLQTAIQDIGLRPVNNVVDATNWVMHETGQPLHAFDANKIAGSEIIVRQAKAGETITTLDEKKRTLTESMMVIADSEKPLVVAGVMGSVDAEVDDTTKDIVLEAAYFTPSSIRATSRTLGLTTDSSQRYSRDVDPTATIFAARRALDLILEIGGGALAQDAIQIGQSPRDEHQINITPDYVRSVCGFDVEDETIKSIYERLGFTVENGGEHWTVTLPALRAEVARPIDLVEEFIRIYGTNRIPEGPVVSKLKMLRPDDGIAQLYKQASDYLCSQHFYESYNYSLLDKDTAENYDSPEALALDNPLTSELTHLRPSLLPGLLENVKRNQHNKHKVCKLFERGRIFKPTAKGLAEYVSVAFVMAGHASERFWKETEAPDFFAAKSLIETLVSLCPKLKKTDAYKALDHPIWQAGHAGTLGELEKLGYSANMGIINLKHTKLLGIEGPVCAGELILSTDLLQATKKIKRFEAFSSFPSVTKDIALLVDTDMSAKSIEKDILQAGQKATDKTFALTSVRPFDLYTGSGLVEGKKSLAYELVFSSDTRTLKDDEVNRAFETIQQSLDTSVYTIRS